MKFFALRHKASKTLMPLIRRGKGYTHWNPSKPIKFATRILNVPRLFESERVALKALNAWATMPNAEMRGYTSYAGEDDYDFFTKEDGRTKDDLEIVPVELTYDS